MLQKNSGQRFSRSVLTSAAFLCALSTFAFANSASPADASAAPLQTPAAPAANAPRYVRAKDGGTKLFNLADKSSLVIGVVPPKGLLEVFGERAGYLSVDAPSGMEVWVYGQYLRATQVPGIVEISGDGVFMRPLPKSDESSYPLQQQLHKGDRLFVVGRGDAKKALAEDWVRVVAPPGTRAWCVADETTAVDAKEDVRGEWSAAVKTAQASRKAYDVSGGSAAAKVAKTDSVKDASNSEATKSEAAKSDADPSTAKKTDSAKTAPAAAQSQASYDTADKMYEAARTSSSPNWSEVRAAYQKYLDKNPDGTFAPQARLQLQKVDLQEEIVRIRKDNSRTDDQRGDLLADAERRLREANQSLDPLMGRFQARGWVVREQPVASDAPRFVVFWAGQPLAEIVCSNGRYDLSKFDQFEIGVSGAVLRTAVAASSTIAARPARIDVTQIEVLGARTTKH